MTGFIVARGVRVNNLKSVDVAVPLGKVVALTGPSGSGKSSLAFDALYAEGQRRYVESLSTYARQFLERLERPDLDSIEGVCPAIAIRHRSASRNPRSTVGTATAVLDHLRLLFARAGRYECAHCGNEVRLWHPMALVERVASLPEGTRALLCFPADGHGPDARQATLVRLQRRGFNRFLVEGEVREADGRTLPAGRDEGLSVLVDRIIVGRTPRSQIAESVAVALAEGEGLAFAHVEGGAPLRLAERMECASCARPYPEPEPGMLSFSSPRGACPDCRGFGNILRLDLCRVVPDAALSLEEGAIEPWRRHHYSSLREELGAFARRHRIPMDRPWSELSEEQRRLVLDGDQRFAGVTGFFRWLEGRKYRVQVRVFLSRYRSYEECRGCGGSRLRREAHQIKIDGRSLPEICRLTVGGAREFLAGVRLEGSLRGVGQRPLDDALRLLGVVERVGLDYLSLERPTSSLSTGEAQRVCLAAALGGGLVGALYVLDEPSVGLHQADTEALIGIMEALRDQGNTVLVVEHDLSIVRRADYVIDLGPGAGVQGGRVVFAGTPADLSQGNGAGLTGKYLRGELSISIPQRRRRPSTEALEIRNARAHNLKGIDIKIPVGALTVVSGVSGSGKTSLVRDVLCAALAERLSARPGRGSGAAQLVGGRSITGFEVVDQSPIGRSPRSNPVTYAKAFDPIRELFATLPEARAQGLGPAHFSFNVAGGRCETCAGDGRIRVDLQFLADLHLTCEACGGRRYRPEVRRVRWRGRTIDEVLDLTVREALQLFAGQPRVVRRLKAMDQIGLGYLRLGQPAGSLSGGEAQRMKLALHLQRRAGQNVLYVLDEPTAGLHQGDVAELASSFGKLLEAGATLVVVEHNLDILRLADWVIDLGPGAGPAGGQVVFEGPPEEMLANGRGRTASALRTTIREAAASSSALR